MDYNSIQSALTYYWLNQYKNIKAADVANHIGLSEAQFNTDFYTWAGTDFKHFVRANKTNYRAYIAQDNPAMPSLFDFVEPVETSKSTSVNQIAINFQLLPTDLFSDKANKPIITYSQSATIFGDVLVASTPLGVCYAAFVEDSEAGMQLLKKYYSGAEFVQEHTAMHQQIVDLINNKSTLNEITFYVKATPFQLSVWQQLVQIPMGTLTTYGAIATKLGDVNASRAVGTAVGKNPITYIVPCHRVIQQSGNLGGYMWGVERKKTILSWEIANTQ